MYESSKKYDCLIFDWDGTLMDSAAQITSAVQAAAAKNDLEVPSSSDIRLGIGTSFSSQYRRLFIDSKPEEHVLLAQKVEKKFKDDFYKSFYLTTPGLFAQVPEILESCKELGCLLAIATSGQRRMLDTMFAEYNLESLFAVTCCGDEYKAKPDPEMLDHIRIELGINPEKILMVGDSVNDIYAAHRAGIKCAAVCTGVNSKSELERAGADFICVDLRDIWHIIKS
ncbi:MAG: HAD family hydrolase [Pseudomonadota bacterium]|nr:HAD family hydrolase [Pseudomonadota bacterium]